MCFFNKINLPNLMGYKPLSHLYVYIPVQLLYFQTLSNAKPPQEFEPDQTLVITTFLSLRYFNKVWKIKCFPLSHKYFYIFT